MNRNEAQLEHLLTLAGYAFERQGKAGGHRIDCLIGNIAVDVNGVWWHAKPKIIECDRVKLPRVVRAGVMPLGLWDSRGLEAPGLREPIRPGGAGRAPRHLGVERPHRGAAGGRSRPGRSVDATLKGGHMPGFVSPQLAHRGNGFGPRLLDDPNYVGEEKWDGLRVQIPIEGHRTQAVFSRTGRQMDGDGLTVDLRAHVEGRQRHGGRRGVLAWLRCVGCVSADRPRRGS